MNSRPAPGSLPAAQLVSSPANARVKRLAGLRRRRAREQEGLTVVEGTEELALAVGSGASPAEAAFCPALFSNPHTLELLEALRDSGIPLIELSPQAFAKASYRDGPDGVMALVPSPGCSLADLHLPDDPFLLLCERIEKPGNLGAMLRTADAVGVDAVLVPDPVTDLGNPNVVRASKGTVFSVPVATTASDDVIGWLAGRGVRLVAATPDTDLVHTDADLTGAVAIAVGAEKQGLTAQLLQAAQTRVRIPMAGRADSLNVSVSAAVLLYEAVRQRAGGR